MKQNQWFDYVLMLFFIVGILYLCNVNMCQLEPKKTEPINPLKAENQALLDEVFELHELIAKQDSTIAAKKTAYIKGKDRIKYLIDKDTLTIHDTLVIEMTAQLDRADSIIELQGAQIDTLKYTITKLEKVISNDSLILSMSENENKALNDTIKKQNKKIKGLKITAVAAPIATILLILGLQ